MGVAALHDVHGDAGSVGMVCEDGPAAERALPGPDVELRRAADDARAAASAAIAASGCGDWRLASHEEAEELFESRARDG